MTLPRIDVRTKLDADDYAALQVLRVFDEMEIGEWVEQLILREIRERHAAARKASSLMELLDEAGISGKTRDNPVTPGKS